MTMWKFKLVYRKSLPNDDVTLRNSITTFYYTDLKLIVLVTDTASPLLDTTEMCEVPS